MSKISETDAETLKGLADELLRHAGCFSITGTLGNVSDTLDKINNLLHLGVSEQDRQTAFRILRDGVREAALSDMETLMSRNPDEFSDQILGLHNQLCELRGKRRYPECSDEDFPLPKDLRPRFRGLSECKTPGSVDRYVSKLSDFLESHPEFREAGYIHLIDIVKSELLAGYLAIFAHLPAKDEAQNYIVSLMTAVEEMYHSDFSLELLSFGAQGFELVSPQSLIEEHNPDTLRAKLKIMCDTLSDMPLERADALIGQLKDSLSKSILEPIKEAFDSTSALPEPIQFCLDRLEDAETGLFVGENDGEPPEDTGALRGLLAAQATLHMLYLHENIEQLKNDWQELLNFAAACPNCVAMLEDRTCEVLTLRVLTWLVLNDRKDIYKIPVPLIRLYLAVNIAATRMASQDEIKDWILQADNA